MNTVDFLLKEIEYYLGFKKTNFILNEREWEYFKKKKKIYVENDYTIRGFEILKDLKQNSFVDELMKLIKEFKLIKEIKTKGTKISETTYTYTIEETKYYLDKRELVKISEKGYVEYFTITENGLKIRR